MKKRPATRNDGTNILSRLHHRPVTIPNGFLKPKYPSGLSKSYSASLLNQFRSIRVSLHAMEMILNFTFPPKSITRLVERGVTRSIAERELRAFRASYWDDDNHWRLTHNLPRFETFQREIEFGTRDSILIAHRVIEISVNERVELEELSRLNAENARQEELLRKQREAQEAEDEARYTDRAIEDTIRAIQDLIRAAS